MLKTFLKIFQHSKRNFVSPRGQVISSMFYPPCSIVCHSMLGSYLNSNFACILGMNTEDYKYKWGGEDWDLLDRVMNARLEVERFKLPGLYHHYHSKYGMWN